MLDEKLVSLRHDYNSCLKLAKETDSKKMEAYLKEEATKALMALKKLCTHEYVVCLCSEYEGSSSWDWDDKHPEERICLCCGITESAYIQKYKETWKQLKAFPIARFEKSAPDEIKYPLSYLFLEVKEIAETKGYQYFGHR